MLSTAYNLVLKRVVPLGAKFVQISGHILGAGRVYILNHQVLFAPAIASQPHFLMLRLITRNTLDRSIGSDVAADVVNRQP